MGAAFPQNIDIVRAVTRTTFFQGPRMFSDLFQTPFQAQGAHVDASRESPDLNIGTFFIIFHGLCVSLP